MAISNQPGERTLYASSDGQVVVSNRRLVLGNEQWNMENVAGASLLKSRKLRWVNWLRLNSKTVPDIIGAGICFALGMGVVFLAVLQQWSGFWTGVAITLTLVFYLAAFFLIFRTWINSAPIIYLIYVVFQDATGVKRELKAKHTFTEHLQALEVEQAIAQVVAGK